MNFKDLKDSLFGGLKKGAQNGAPQEDAGVESNLPNGGFSGYQPNQQTRKNRFGTQTIRTVQPQPQGAARSGGSGMTRAFDQVQGSPYNMPPMMPYPAQQPQQGYGADPARQYTAGLGGFGGFTRQQPVQQTGWQQPQGATMQQNWQQMNPTMQQPVQQNPWQPQQQPQPQPQQNWQQGATVQQNYPPQMNPAQQQAPGGTMRNFMQMFGMKNEPAAPQQPQQPPMQQGNPTMQQRPMQPFGQQAAPQQTMQNPWPPQPQQAQQAQQSPVGGLTGRFRGLKKEQPKQEPNNISYIDRGNFVGTDGKAYRHVERVAQLVSVSACFRIIEFMRNGESVIVNTESIANEADVQRCLDMLAGAAFTLGCSLTKITQVKRAYLIAPAAVLVMQDSAVSRWNENDQVSGASAAQETPYPGQFRPEHRAYVPDRAYNTDSATTYPQTVPAQAEPAPSPYQPTMRQHTTRTQPREAYQSDTRRGFYGTAAGQNMGGFGQ